MDRQEWLKWRQRGIGSSDAPIIMGASPWKTRIQLYHDKTATEVTETSSNWAMQKGNELEPIARVKFTSWYNISEGGEILFQPRLCVLNEYPFLKASLDAANPQGEVDVFAEIKFQGKNDFAFQGVPDKYFWQLQHQHLVTGGKAKAFFVGINANEVIKVLPVEPDIEAMRKLLAECILFWECVQQKIEPEETPQDFKIVLGKEHEDLANHYVELSKKIEALEEAKELVKKSLITLCEHPRNIIGPLRLTQVNRVGNVDYAKVPELKGVDLEQYRKKPSTFWKLHYAEPARENKD
jgi:putative phage-type endonuclease